MQKRRELVIRSVIIHVLGITAFLCIPIVASPDFSTGQNLLMITGFQRNFVSYLLLLIFFYANYYYFIPAFYFPKKKLLYGGFMILSYLAVLLMPKSIIQNGFHLQPTHMPGRPVPPGPFFAAFEGSSIVQFLLVMSLSILLRINKRMREIYSEKLKAEVSYLKAQINPHFLFNTLNSLYALTLDKSDSAPDAVIKLSNMMRYVVTESTNEFVALEKEINYIGDYINMQRLRIPDQDNLEYNVNGNPKGKVIAPLVIIPFIENAFKYGINPEQNWHISIHIQITESDFILDVVNNKVNSAFPDAESSEQGIENAARRLDVIYPGKHELTLSDTSDTFRAHLKIELL